MKALIQRVTRATVSVDSHRIGRCERGFLILLGVGPHDQETDARWLAQKIAGLRVFPDKDGRMNLSLMDIQGEALVVSQFTLYGDCSKGRRPSFVGSAPPMLAERLYDRFVKLLSELNVPTQTGQFGADMQVELLNDGPVTLMIESPQKKC